MDCPTHDGSILRELKQYHRLPHEVPVEVSCIEGGTVDSHRAHTRVIAVKLNVVTHFESLQNMKECEPIHGSVATRDVEWRESTRHVECFLSE